MKNSRPIKNKSNKFIVKNHYCIFLENASKKTQGGSSFATENTAGLTTFPRGRHPLID